MVFVCVFDLKICNEFPYTTIYYFCRSVDAMRKYISINLLIAFLLTGCSDNGEKISPNDNLCNNSVYYDNIRYIRPYADYYENGVIYGNDAAMFLDFDTMEKSKLCAVPNCTHDSGSCLAYTVGNAPVLYNDNIYYFMSNPHVEEDSNGRKLIHDTKLMKASLDSSETEVFCRFSDSTPSATVNYGYQLVDNMLYFVGNDLNPTIDEYGVLSYSNSGGYHYLCSINLDTGEYKNYGSIYDGDKQYDFADNSSQANIGGWYNGKLYVVYGFIKEKPPEDATDVYTFLNFEFDTETQTLTESSLPRASYMDNDTYVYCDKSKNTTTVIDKGKNYTIPDCNSAYVFTTICNNKLFTHDSWYDLSDFSKHSLGEETEFYSVTYHNGKYIFIKGGKITTLTEEELIENSKVYEEDLK